MRGKQIGVWDFHSAFIQCVYVVLDFDRGLSFDGGVRVAPRLVGHLAKDLNTSLTLGDDDLPYSIELRSLDR